MKNPAVYIMANKRSGTLYTGVTSNLVQRAYQHQQGLFEGFSKKYNCKLLVFYDLHRACWQLAPKPRRSAACPRNPSDIPKPLDTAHKARCVGKGGELSTAPSNMESATLREKQIKSGSRKKKPYLIENMNPQWLGMYLDIVWLDGHAAFSGSSWRFFRDSKEV